ncbi:hypothetical protein BDN70DRAFT_886312 [Pholiota conissans]|uniref:Uncharacterized protein n=1 Tax=Pholiota conissans TaxID=109636 RepID=A0A9P6CNM0_9AGAR|nr:hypothetical protein BDN70DRAFT_886312 [Pholiota conissans]
MSQHIQHHHPQTQYVHYNPNPHLQQQVPVTHVAPKDTQRQPVAQQQQQAPIHHQPQPQQQQQQQQAGPSGQASSSSSTPLVAKGDWTKDLVHLAKTAELKKHALTLQLHTAHILSAHASLEQKGKAIQDLREQKNKLESERTRLLNCLREVNEDRDKVDIMESSLEKECRETRAKITQLTENDYAVAKADVDRLRQELGQPPLPSLQSTLEEKTSQYLNERRISGNESQSASVAGPSRSGSGAAPAATNKRPASTSTGQPEGMAKRPRGRPKGSKNKNKASGDD